MKTQGTICLSSLIHVIEFQLDITAANIGLAISSILGLSYKFQWGMRQSSELENYMISVERCLEYVQLSPEKPIETDRPLPEAWPGSGSIQFSNVSLAYGTKKVLEDLSFEIKSKERIGIVGRTGAGKSSIIAALFRMADEISGDIYFDGVSTADLGLLDLRQNISIIPQDPVLYSGSVRHNLDPFNKFEDADVWKVIEDVN
jgi:ATP-binding cassette subfamily C (CFTR/MRP) protein 4